MYQIKTYFYNYSGYDECLSLSSCHSFSSFTQLLRGLNNLRKSNLLKEEFEIYCGTRLIDIHPNNIKHLKHLN
jgi:hypothetical protein